MKYIKLFEEVNIQKEDFPKNGYELSTREKQVLNEIFGHEFFFEKRMITIKKEDFYYYVKERLLYTITEKYEMFESFDDLINYLFLEFIDLGYTDVKRVLSHPRIDPSVFDNRALEIAVKRGDIKTLKLLMEDPRVDPSFNDNFALKWSLSSNRYEIVKLLLADPRVDPIDQNKDIIELLLNDDRVLKNLNPEEIDKLIRFNEDIEIEKNFIGSGLTSKQKSYIMKSMPYHNKKEIKLNPDEINKYRKTFPKLFEEVLIDKNDFPINGHKLSKKEKDILNDIFSLDAYYIYGVEISKEDFYYYLKCDKKYYVFDSFDELIDQLFLFYFSLKHRNRYLDGIAEVLDHPRINPNAHDGAALKMAINSNSLHVIHYLIENPMVDPSVGDNIAIRRLSMNGARDLVYKLLKDPRVDPSDKNNEAILFAIEAYEHNKEKDKATAKVYKDIIKMLSNNRKVWEKLNDDQKKFINTEIDVVPGHLTEELRPVIVGRIDIN